MKKILRIKIENITATILTGLFIYSIISHKQVNFGAFISEMIVYMLLTFGLHYGLKECRKEALYECR